MFEIDSLRPEGSYRKKHPLDCGTTNCWVCHSMKRKTPRIAQQRSDIDLKEQTDDLA